MLQRAKVLLAVAQGGVSGMVTWKDMEMETALGLMSLPSFVVHRQCGSSEHSTEKFEGSHNFLQLKYKMN